MVTYFKVRGTLTCKTGPQPLIVLGAGDECLASSIKDVYVARGDWRVGVGGNQA